MSILSANALELPLGEDIADRVPCVLLAEGQCDARRARYANHDDDDDDDDVGSRADSRWLSRSLARLVGCLLCTWGQVRLAVGGPGDRGARRTARAPDAHPPVPRDPGVAAPPKAQPGALPQVSDQ